MVNFLIVLYFINFSYGLSLYEFKKEQLLPEPPDCGTVQHLTKRLYGGSPINVTHIPWMVAIEYEDSDEDVENKTSVNCGGTLINNRYVITAAHCIEDETPVSILLGTTNSSDVGTRIKVEKSISHKDYQSYEEDVAFKGENDIALIRMAKDVEYSKYIQPICMPFSVSNYEPPTNETSFTIAGWGNRRFTLNNEILEFVEVPFFSFEDCEKVYENYGRDISDNSLCAGGVVGKSFCNKDGGGPLMRQLGDQWILDGIITKTTEDGCASKTPGIFINVLKYERWIKEHIIYGWSSKKEIDDDDEELTNWDKFVNAISDRKFWLSVLVILFIIVAFISCGVMANKLWKTHSTCIIAFGIVLILMLIAIYIVSYFI